MAASDSCGDPGGSPIFPTPFGKHSPPPALTDTSPGTQEAPTLPRRSAHPTHASPNLDQDSGSTCQLLPQGAQAEWMEGRTSE